MSIINGWGKIETLNYIYNVIPINGNIDYMLGERTPKQNLNKLTSEWLILNIFVFEVAYFSSLR